METTTGQPADSFTSTRNKDYILSHLDFKAFYKSHVTNLKENGKAQALGLCPFHDDHNPSLSVNLENGLYHCFACGAKGDVFKFYQDYKKVDFKTALSEIALTFGIEESPESKRRISETYNYVDAAGKFIFQCVRYEPKDFRQRRPDGKNGWIWNLDGINPVLYCLPELVKAKTDEFVFIPEGEKDCDNLRTLGLVATTNPMGAGKWRDDYAAYLKGKDVVILPDNDQPGRDHAFKAAASLAGVAKSVKVIELSGLPEKGDISDWLDLRDAKEPEALKTELLGIAQKAPEWTPPKEIEVTEEADKKRPTQTEYLLSLALELTLFHDQNKTPFVYLKNEVIPLSASKFKNYLSYLYYKAEGKAPNSDALNQVLSVLKGQALFERPLISLHNRIAEKDGAFWYDLAEGRAVKITPKGWEIIADIPILFRRYTHQQPQIEPERGGNVSDIFKFLNVDEQHHLLVLVYILSCFIPEIPHPIFHPHGQHGAGKTTMCNVIKKLCDPSSIEAVITPRDATQLVQVLAHHHICLFDNMSDLPAWMSDILAQACTGGGFSKRQLFTDDEDIIYQVKRCIGLNGINLLISRSDLMDRSILLHLERIQPANRREEKELWAEFEKHKAGILGGIFDVLSKAMAVYPEIKTTRLPRMADFARWGCAIAVTLGRKQADFEKAYQLNIIRQNEEVILSNSLAQAVLQFMGDKREWNGTVKQVYQTLKELTMPDKADGTFPKSERSLRKHLNRIKTNLMDTGITFTIGERGAEGIPIHFQQIPKLSTGTTLSTQKGVNPGHPVDNVDDFLFSWTEGVL